MCWSVSYCCSSSMFLLVFCYSCVADIDKECLVESLLPFSFTRGSVSVQSYHWIVFRRDALIIDQLPIGQISAPNNQPITDCCTKLQNAPTIVLDLMKLAEYSYSAQQNHAKLIISKSVDYWPIPIIGWSVHLYFIGCCMPSCMTELLSYVTPAGKLGIRTTG